MQNTLGAVARPPGATRWSGRGRLVMVGGGPSCASVVIRLAEIVAGGGRRADLPELVLVDRHGETGGGAPHAAGTSQALLLNDNVAEIDSTGIGLRDWLATHQRQWLGALAGDRDSRVARWVGDHRAEIVDGDLDALFLPRAVFGAFMRDRFAAARRQLAAAGVPLRVRTGEVRAITRSPAGQWHVTIATVAQPLVADAVLLGVGSLAAVPPAALAGHPRFLTSAQACDLPYVESVLLADTSGASPARPGRAVVLGSSAAATEFLYGIEGSPRLTAAVERVAVISTSGRIAGGLPSGLSTPYRGRHLRDLAATSGLTSARLVAAMERDLSGAAAAGYHLVDVLAEVDAAFGTAFAGLPPAEKRRFVERDVTTYRQLIRHTSTDYAAAVRRLSETGRLRVVRGAVDSVGVRGDGWFEVGYRAAGGPATLDADVVVDCRGHAGVGADDRSLIGALVRDGAVRVNACGRGLEVDEHFQVAPGMYLMGPLLAGTSQGVDHIWYLENIGRIYTLAARCASALWDRLAGVHR